MIVVWKDLHSSYYDQQPSASAQLAHPLTILQRSKQGQDCDGVCFCSVTSVTQFFFSSCLRWRGAALTWGRGSLLLHEVPRYPGAHTHVPSSGEQEPPFWQEQLNEQLGPQKPCRHTLSQWIPAGMLTKRILCERTVQEGEKLECSHISEQNIYKDASSQNCIILSLHLSDLCMAI